MSIENTVSKMLGMKFGSYKASVNNMNTVYQNVNDERKVDTILLGGLREQVDGSYEENGKQVAFASYVEFDGKSNYSVWDAKMHRTYSSGWDNSDSDKFNYIAFDDYAVEDANKNGVLDENDLIYLNEGEKQKQTIKDFLS